MAESASILSPTRDPSTHHTQGGNPTESVKEDVKTCAYCFNSCDKKCSNCFKVHYCSIEHQKLHRKIHKQNCFPAVEVKNDQFGHHLVATKTIVPGNQILTAKPLAISPFGINSTNHPICLGCCKILPGKFGRTTQICQNCSWPLCKQDCEDILIHTQNECEIFMAQKILPSKFIYEFIMRLRILLLKEKDPIKFNKFLELESHAEIRKQSKWDSEQLVIFIKFIHDSCKLNETVYSTDLIDKIFGVTMFNSVTRTVSMVPGEVSESHIYEWTSKLSHNCIQNVEVITVDVPRKAVRITATTEIRQGDILSECYAFDMINWQGVVERRKYFHETYNFWCTCLRCSDPTELGTNFSAIKCKSKDVNGRMCSGFYLLGNALDNDSLWICNSGNSTCAPTKYSELSGFVRSIELDILLARNIEEKIAVLDKHAHISVHENHFTLMKLRFDLLHDILVKLTTLFGFGTNSQLALKMKEMALKCLEIADKFTPGLSKHRGQVLFFLGQAMYICVMHTETQDRFTLGRVNLTNGLSEEFEKISLIREETKLILKDSNKNSEEYRLYEYIIESDDKFYKHRNALTSSTLRF